MSVIKKLTTILTKSQRIAGFLQLVLLIIGMVLETLSVGLLIPALTMLSQGDLFIRYPSMRSILIKLGNPSQKELLIGFMIILVLVYFLKMLFLAFMSWKQSKFIFELQSYFSQKIFEGYLSQPYSFHLQKNSAILIKNATTMVSQMTGSLLYVLTSLTELFTLIGILSFLFFMEPIATTTIILFLGISSFTFQRLTSKQLLKWGKAFQFHEGMKIQHLQQGLGGVKDVKLMGREKEFIDQFAVHNFGSSKMNQRQQALQVLPRLWIELLSIIGMAGLVIVMSYNGKSLGLILTTLGLFAVAAFRMIPSLNRIMASLQSIRYTEPSVDILFQELSMINHTNKTIIKSEKPLTFKKSIQLENIYFKYDSAHKDSLRGVSLLIPCGSTVGFIGTTGAGKSTLVDIILGLLDPVKGEIKIDGLNIQNNLRSWQKLIGYVPQTIYLTDDSLRRNIAFGIPSKNIDDVAINNAIKAAQLNEFIKSLPDGLDTIVGERGVRLSGGQRQRIGIARALYHNPSVLVLDEATSSLDNKTEEDVMEAINALRGFKTIIIIAHRLSTVEYCDIIYKIEDGRIIDKGDVKKVLSEKLEK